MQGHGMDITQHGGARYRVGGQVRDMQLRFLRNSFNDFREKQL